MPHDWIDVATAARFLDVNQARVRAMIAAGLLDARKVGGRWLLDPASVDRRRVRDVPAGRPMGARNAWGLLWIAAGRNPGWLSPWARSRVRRRLREEGVVALAPRLHGRASLRAFRAHPSDVDRIASDGDVVRTGVSAASGHDVPLVAPGQVDLYVHEPDLQHLVERYALQPETARPNVTARVVAGLWPFEPGDEIAPASAVGVDLLESTDARTSREGLRLLERLEATWSI